MNFTTPAEFFLLNVTDVLELHIPLFILFFLVYMATLSGNFTMLSVIPLDHRLHSPMYKLLWTFSLMDFSFSSTTVPRMLSAILVPNTSISFCSCIVQIFFFHAFGNSENLLLSAMAYDRYAAICHPLRYNVLMSNQTCLALCSGCCTAASLHALLHAIVTSRLDFHLPSQIPHFFCDIPPLLEISSSDTSFNQLLIYSEGSAIALVPLLLIILSYVQIALSIFHIRSSSGRNKAFSTCASHLMVFFLFSASAVSMYFKPSSGSSAQKGRAITLLYTAFTPMLNPYIYCLRNNEVKSAIQKTLGIKEKKTQK